MNMLVLMGSPRAKGHTAALLEPFLAEVRRLGATVECVSLHGKRIQTCLECFQCQKTQDAPGCGLSDDMDALFPEILKADVLVLATPIFTWFCPPEMKAAMDRCFCLSKKYGGGTDTSMLLAGKRVALVTTYGDPPTTGPDLLEKAIQRLCHYAEMDYAGLLGVRDVHGISDFRTASVVQAAQDFADSLVRGFARA